MIPEKDKTRELIFSLVNHHWNSTSFSSSEGGSKTNPLIESFCLGFFSFLHLFLHRLVCVEKDGDGVVNSSILEAARTVKECP